MSCGSQNCGTGFSLHVESAVKPGNLHRFQLCMEYNLLPPVNRLYCIPFPAVSASVAFIHCRQIKCMGPVLVPHHELTLKSPSTVKGCGCIQE